MRASRDDLCHGCHARPAPKGSSRCGPCAQSRRELEARQRTARRRNGLCVTCKAKVAAGRRYCATHLRYYAERAKAAAAR
jgi:hypothetical protein